MKKSTVPTSTYQLFCDTFDTKLEAKMHEVDGKKKLLISIGSVEDSEERKSISIYAEEVNLLSQFLKEISYSTDYRLNK